MTSSRPFLDSPGSQRPALGALVFMLLLLAITGLRAGTANAPLHLQKVRPQVDSWLGLANLPGSSVALARRVVSFREHVAMGAAPDNLRYIPGLGTRRLHNWSSWLVSQPR